jgi:hypothetical protein
LAIDDELFWTLLEHVRDLRRRTEEVPRSKTWVHHNIRARLSSTDPPSLTRDRRDVADDGRGAEDTTALDDAVAEALAAYFGK